MIPKIIHYCWFGGKPLPENVKKYISTWTKYLPGFKIKQWDESNFDVNALQYTRQAYFAGKYAFVSDVARLYALMNEGGLYLDTDILIKKPFPEEWFALDAFGSFEHDVYVQTGIIACVAHHPLISAFYDTYQKRAFFHGLKFDITTNVSVFTKLMAEYGFEMNDTEQTINGFTVFPQKYLCANDWLNGRYDDDDTFAVHDFRGSWGKDVLKSVISYRFKSAMTVAKWKIRELMNK